MHIRRLKKEEIDYSIAMSEFAFQYELSEQEREERRKLIKPENTWVAEENGEILSKSTTLPLHTYVFGEKIPMGGVSGVVTWPEHRRAGLVKELLHHSLKDMRENGQILSFLYPFSIPFYRKMGWELFAEQQKITISKNQLPTRKETRGSVRREEKDFTLIDEVYQSWAKKYLGTLARNEEWWNSFVFRKKNNTLAVYYDDTQKPQGYIIYNVKDEKMTIVEMVWLHSEARTGLFTFISNHDSMIEKVEWHTVPHSGIPFILEDPKVEREVVSYFMARIVDVKEFLTLYPFLLNEADEPLVLHVQDEFCKWNDGTYFIKAAQDKGEKINFFPSKAQGSCQHPPQKGISLSVQALTAILFNSQSAATLFEEDVITGSTEAVRQLAAAIPAKLPFIYDFF